MLVCIVVNLSMYSNDHIYALDTDSLLFITDLKDEELGLELHNHVIGALKDVSPFMSITRFYKSVF